MFPYFELKLDFLDIVYYVIQKLYIYCHLKSNQDETKEEIEEDIKFDTAIMTIIICILSFSIIKMCIIFVHFFIVNTIINAGKFCYRVIRFRCCINLLEEAKYAYFYFIKIVKKFYTNNFYSYENRAFGGFFVTFYLLFILFNLFFTFDNAVIDCKDKSKNVILRIMQIISFELNIFMEIVCCTFFIYRIFKKQFIFISISFFALNTIVASVIYYRISHDKAEKEIFDVSIYIAKLIFLTFYVILAYFSIKAVSEYNLNLEYWKCFIEEKEKFYTEKGNEIGLSMVNDEKEKINQIASNIKLENIYYNYKSDYFFKRRDRFHHQKKLIVLFVVMIITNCTEIVYSIVKIIHSNEEEETIFWYRTCQKFASMFHTICVIMISWIIFMKMELRTLVLY